MAQKYEVVATNPPYAGVTNLSGKLNEYVKTYPGVFGAEMLVNIENDGPITIIIDSME